MKCTDLRVKAVAYLRAEVERVLKRPHKLIFSAKVVSEAVGGYAGTLGLIADQVVSDLRASDIDCCYYRNQSPKIFVIDLPG